MSAPSSTAPPDQATHAFLLRTAELLHRCGTPSYRLEGVMGKVASGLNVPSVFLYTPTALVISLGSGTEEKTWLRRVNSGDIDISKILAFDAILEELAAGSITVQQAAAKLESAASAQSRFSTPLSLFAAAMACTGIAVIFGGNAIEMLIAGIFGCLIAWASLLFHRPGAERGWLEPLLGFTAAIAAVAVSHWIPVNDRLITLAALILPIPGFTLTIALTELATGHLSSGSARLAGALVTLFTLVVGVAIAWRITAGWAPLIPPPGAPFSSPLPWWSLWIAVSCTPIAFGIVFKVPVSQWPAITLVVISGFAAVRFVTALAGPEVGAFAGALVVGCGSNLYARLRNRPAMVPQTPGLMILVPGSLGYKSLTAMVDSETLKGVELAFSMSIIGVALVGGLLLANQIISPRRSL